MFSARIEMDFAELMGLSDSLRELAEEMQKSGQGELLESAYLLQAGWNSICGKETMKKEVEIAGEIARQAEELAALAQEIEQTARKMYRSEMTNQVRARTRTYY